MLKQASVSDLITDRVSREKGYIVITMRRYPRFVNKLLRDEYLNCMSPDWPLFEDWLSAKRRYQNHDGAFGKAHFEERFDINDEGMGHLKRLSELAKTQDVYLVCQCHSGLRCHREFLLILAKKVFRAKVELPKNPYPRFEKRLPEFSERALALFPKARRKSSKRLSSPEQAAHP